LRQLSTGEAVRLADHKQKTAPLMLDIVTGAVEKRGRWKVAPE
jgi:hypothetical protein